MCFIFFVWISVALQAVLQLYAKKKEATLWFVYVIVIMS